ncbi:MAG TPA: ABC transporter ATP-binding protein [Spirochaetota bacterium]|nr:ABC transporter ATP-binding protein [Spirochaetota bacterium]HPN83402.1 ABC transporter ATP-binding protein [Spirochaetota bacterium]
MNFALRGVSKSFSSRRGRVSALSGVDLEVQDGEFLCILGPSGCGKSSLLNIMAGLDREYQGQALANGKLIAGPSAERLLLFQEPALFPWMNIAENVAFGLAARGLPRCERKPVVDRYLAMVHLEAFAHAHPHELSGGMRQRAALARALAVDPDLLLMDEPFAALDAQTRDMLHGELQEVWTTTGKTIVFVTHNVREALILGDRVLLMSARPGKIKKEFVFDLPRPRHFEDPGIAEAARVVLADLKAEVERARDEEVARVSASR